LNSYYYFYYIIGILVYWYIGILVYWYIGIDLIFMDKKILYGWRLWYQNIDDYYAPVGGVVLTILGCFPNIPNNLLPHLFG